MLGVDAALPAAGNRFSILGDREAALRGFGEGELLVSEPLARRLGIEAGAVLSLPAAAADRPLRVAGVYRDYGNEQGALFLDRTLMNSFYPPDPGVEPPVHGVALYLRQARRSIADILRRGKLPVVAGGSGQYVWGLLEGWQIPEAPPSPALRAELEARAASERRGQRRSPVTGA